jgi:hypothetical protein
VGGTFACCCCDFGDDVLDRGGVPSLSPGVLGCCCFAAAAARFLAFFFWDFDIVEMNEVEEGVAVEVESGVGGGGSAIAGGSPSWVFLLPLRVRSGRDFVIFAVVNLNNFVSDLQTMLNR